MRQIVHEGPPRDPTGHDGPSIAVLDTGARKKHPQDTGDDDAALMSSMAPLPGGGMWIDRRFRDSLERAGLVSFQAMMATTTGRLLRALPDRENWRLDLPEDPAPPRGAFLKKHHVRGWKGWLRAKLGWGPGMTPGRVEAVNVARLERERIAAMSLIAFGERLHENGLCESFVLTEELSGHVQLDHFLRARFPSLATGRTPADERDLRSLIAEVGDLARQFHEHGFNHRDFYCCHFFIREAPPGRFHARLIDLQRVERRRFNRRRWLVKDLAQLAYSCPKERISRRDRVAFIKRYLGVAKLGPAHKRLIRRVLFKRAMIEWRRGPHP